MLIEAVGYAASALVAASLVMVSVLRLRIINLAGAVCFVIYGIAISSVPLVITNGFITVVNIYHIARILKTRPGSFRYIEASPERREEIREFVEHYRADMRKYYPAFAVDLADEVIERHGSVFLAVHNLRVEGLAYLLDINEAIEALSGTQARRALERAAVRPHDGSMSYLGVDYITAQYRDLGLAQKLYDRIDEGRPRETVVCLVPGSARRSRRFLTANGFSLVLEEEAITESDEAEELLLFARTFAG